MERLNEDLTDNKVIKMIEAAISAAREEARKPIPAVENCLQCGTRTDGKRWCNINCLKDWQAESR